jgi:hypothetical protein
MKNINNFIQEKLIINKDTEVINELTPEVMRDDYNSVWGATTKKRKKEFADKYACDDIRIRPIQIAILDKLRELRFDKDEYDTNDRSDFFKYDITQVYNKLKVWLDKEPIEFVQYLSDVYAKLTSKINPFRCSIADKRKLDFAKGFKRYLDEHK